jgi:peptide/nickel transport system ATP-binding protein
MYLGRIVELASNKSLFDKPLHPYTEALMSAVPQPDPLSKKRRILLEGDVPSPINPPSGCSFHPRCQKYKKKCTETIPKMEEIDEGHFVACHFVRR